MISSVEQERIDRILREVTHPIPKRIYHDDAQMLLIIIERLKTRIAELEKELEAKK